MKSPHAFIYPGPCALVHLRPQVVFRASIYRFTEEETGAQWGMARGWC